MSLGGFSPLEMLGLVQHELLLFAAVFFVIGAVDEFAVDLCWIWLKLTGRVRTTRLPADFAENTQLMGVCAVFIPAWQEHGVIGTTVSHALAVWAQPELRLYVGCYRNDTQTIAAVIKAGGGDTRLRIVIHDKAGPTTKADCLNRLYRALCDDEARSGERAHMVVMHDAEDMVDPVGLPLLDRATRVADLVQLPVLPIPQGRSRWIGSHYCEEFAEAHAKGMVVRDAIGAAIPSAGVGCAMARSILDRLAADGAGDMPFAAECLTEDYELGLRIAELGGTTRFIRVRSADGRLIATRACFPHQLGAAVRQKTRWVLGIAFQGWDRLGWKGGVADFWMRVRDRRGPFTAIVLASAYLLLVLSTVGWAANLAGMGQPIAISPLLEMLLIINFASFAWRAAARFSFAANEYGLVEGLRAVFRIPITNIIAIMAGRRALVAYFLSLRGAVQVWDKTTHDAHPALEYLDKPVLAEASA
ncbi:glycosyl transferase family protein [Altererythrobacter aquiaggeris]|uniref:glycosyl transferase family protein n=1 Tax=Aestuarierythrobacter aquiaggeris TaxID=1898396 RepID=UPI00301695D0